MGQELSSQTNAAERPSNSSTGIVSVTAVPGNASKDKSADKYFTELKAIPKFQPLIKTSVGQAPSASYFPASKEGTSDKENIPTAAFYELLTKLQKHYLRCATSIASEQKSIFDNLVELQVETSRIENAVKDTVTQASKEDTAAIVIPKLHQELHKTHSYIYEIMNVLDELAVKKGFNIEEHAGEFPTLAMLTQHREAYKTYPYSYEHNATSSVSVGSGPKVDTRSSPLIASSRQASTVSFGLVLDPVLSEKHRNSPKLSASKSNNSIADHEGTDYSADIQ